MGNKINENHHISMNIIYKWEIGKCSIAMFEIPGRQIGYTYCPFHPWGSRSDVIYTCTPGVYVPYPC
jgi:hypothetical protein